jgi:mycofactocin precursor
MTTEADAASTADEHVSADAEDELIEDELVIEEISVDGMCGVY